MSDPLLPVRDRPDLSAGDLTDGQRRIGFEGDLSLAENFPGDVRRGCDQLGSRYHFVHESDPECFLGIDLVTDRDAKTPANDLAEAVMYAALDAGLSFKTTMGNVLTLTPPLTITETQMLHALDIVEAAIAAHAANTA